MKPTPRLILCTVALSLLMFHPRLDGQTAPTLTTLHGFTGSAAEGSSPAGALVQGHDGNFYGTTPSSTISGSFGTVFVMTPAGKITSLHQFTGIDPDGASPVAGLTVGGDGSFYGTTSNGGRYDEGTIFEITPGGAYTTLFSFDDADGFAPVGDLTVGRDGAFYGTTSVGGFGGVGAGIGTVFRFTKADGLSTLHQFAVDQSEGVSPTDLIEGSDGSFYGTTTSGGKYQKGTAFRIPPGGDFVTTHHFSGIGMDGAYPQGRMARGSDGNFYGRTTAGGSDDEGTVFQLTPAGKVTTFYSFLKTVADGRYPHGGLMLASDSNLYGTTSESGSKANGGTIFRLTPAGVLTTPHRFMGGKEGSDPEAALVQGSDGNFYGTTSGGSIHGYGTVYKLDGPPIITSKNTATATVGKAFSYQITATGNPTGYGVGRLIKGLTVDQNTGRLSGTPQKATMDKLILRATNGSGTGEETLTLTVNAE